MTDRSLAILLIGLIIAVFIFIPIQNVVTIYLSYNNTNVNPANHTPNWSAYLISQKVTYLQYFENRGTSPELNTTTPVAELNITMTQINNQAVANIPVSTFVSYQKMFPIAGKSYIIYTYQAVQNGETIYVRITNSTTNFNKVITLG